MMNIGLDFGNTIVYGPPNGAKVLHDGAVEVIAMMAEEVGRVGGRVYIVSKATRAQAARTMSFCEEDNFFNNTGIQPADVHFCETREQKAPIVKHLNIGFFVDDRPEVMSHLPIPVVKVLFKPEPADVVKYFNQLKVVKIAQTWAEVYRWFLKEMYD